MESQRCEEIRIHLKGKLKLKLKTQNFFKLKYTHSDINQSQTLISTHDLKT